MGETRDWPVKSHRRTLLRDIRADWTFGVRLADKRHAVTICWIFIVAVVLRDGDRFGYPEWRVLDVPLFIFEHTRSFFVADQGESCRYFLIRHGTDLDFDAVLG